LPRTKERIEEIKTCHKAAFCSEPGYIPLSIRVSNPADNQRAGLKSASDFLRAAKAGANLTWWQALHDVQVCLEMGLKSIELCRQVDSDWLPFMRMAYQDVLVQSLFGAEIHDNAGMMPDTLPFLDDIEEVKDLPMPEITSGLTEKALEDYRYLRENLPEEVEVIPIFVMDPFGIAVTLRGSDFYADLIAEPELSNRLLQIITDVVIDLIAYFKRRAGQGDREYVTNRGLYLPGFRVSSDYMIHLSPTMIKEFMFPLFERIAVTFGPVLIHYCTEPQDTSHVLPTLLECDALLGVDTWQGYDSLVGFDKRYRLQEKLVICTDISPPASKAEIRSLLQSDIFRLATEGKRGLLVSTEVPDVDSGNRLYEMWREVSR